MMRQSINETFAHETNNRLFSIDFHDFMEKESILNDVELSSEFHISVKEVNQLKRKMKR